MVISGVLRRPGMEEVVALAGGPSRKSEVPNHRCPFWLVCLKNRGPWFRWGLFHLPGPSIFSKRPPMSRTCSDMAQFSGLYKKQLDRKTIRKDLHAEGPAADKSLSQRESAREKDSLLKVEGKTK